jgi:dolichol-phosphate mannosyltransferase
MADSTDSGLGAPALTVLVPVFNEAGNIAPLADEVMAALAGIGAFELLFVDDGSTDATPAELAAAQLRHTNVRIIRHKRRAGKSAALATGFRAAKGAWIQTLDGDRQNDPNDAADVWRKLQAPNNGSGPPPRLGLVAGIRKRRNDGVVKFLSSRIANVIRRTMLRDATPDTGCGFKLIRRDVAVTLPFFDGMHRFLPALVRRAGYEVMQVPVNDRPRMAGQSKYGFFGRLGAGIVDLWGVFWLMRRGTHTEAEEILCRK